MKGANITPDPETGIGKWTDADIIKRALLAGVRPNGTQIAPIMPYGLDKVFTPADMDAVVAYLKSVAPVRERGRTIRVQGRNARRCAAWR